MSSLWPWLAVAGAGAVHGLNPAAGWMFAAAWGLRPGGRGKVLRTLLPIAIGHAASVGLVGAAIVFGLSVDRLAMQILAGVLLAAILTVHLSRGRFRAAPTRAVPARQAGLALWSFMMSTAHGAGLMLVPALMPVCVVGAPAQTGISAGTVSDSLVLALLAMVVHTAAMLVVSGIMAVFVCRGVNAGAGLLRRCRHTPSPAVR
jgi:hypothetical protein